MEFGRINLHLSRRVDLLDPESLSLLSFRHRATKELAHLGLKGLVVVPDRYLHVTTLHLKNHPFTEKDLPAATKDWPTHASEALRVTMKGARVLGNSSLATPTSFAIELNEDDPVLRREHEHFSKVYHSPYDTNNYIPHITAVRVTESVSPEAAQEVSDWITENITKKDTAEIKLKPTRADLDILG